LRCFENPLFMRIFSLFAILLSFLMFFTNCSNNSSKDKFVIEQLNEKIDRANCLYKDDAMIQYEILKERQYDVQTAARAMIWFPKADTVKKVSDELVAYIEGMKTYLKTTVTDERNSTEVVHNLFIKTGKGRELYQKMENYRLTILRLDSFLEKSSKRNNENFFTLINESEDSLIKRGEDFAATYFDKTTKHNAICLLNGLQNNVMFIQRNIINYFKENSTYHGCGYTAIAALVTQNSSCVSGGEKIEITAGIGSFSGSMKPEIVINNQVISLSPEMVANYVMKAEMQPGKYLVPVKMSFTKPDGSTSVFRKNVEYTVR
jgi:hypothetical protein